MHGCIVYTELAPRRQQFHVAPAMSALKDTTLVDLQKSCYKNLVTHVESHASTVSLLKRVENSAIQVIINQSMFTVLFCSFFTFGLRARHAVSFVLHFRSVRPPCCFVHSSLSVCMCIVLFRSFFAFHPFPSLRLLRPWFDFEPCPNTLTSAGTPRLQSKGAMCCIVMWGLSSCSHVSSFHESIYAPEMEINPPKNVCGCLCGRVIKNDSSRNPPLTLRNALVSVQPCTWVALAFSWRKLQQQQQQFPRLKEVPICFLCLLKTFCAQARVRFFVSFENILPRLE